MELEVVRKAVMAHFRRVVAKAVSGKTHGGESRAVVILRSFSHYWLDSGITSTIVLHFLPSMQAVVQDLGNWGSSTANVQGGAS